VCIQKFPDRPPGARTANGMTLCHYVQLYRYFVSQFSEFCHHNPLRCFLTSVCCCKRIFRYRLSPETFGYTLINRSPVSKSFQCYRNDNKCETWSLAPREEHRVKGIENEVLRGLLRPK
jgi:hypothetical protein